MLFYVFIYNLQTRGTDQPPAMLSTVLSDGVDKADGLEQFVELENASLP